MLPRFLATLAILAVWTSDLWAQQGNWPGWRGDGSGVSQEVGLPLEWSDDQGIVWKAPILGEGHSSPIVWGDRVFITAARERTDTIITKSLMMGLVALGGLLVVVAAVATAVMAVRRRGDRSVTARGPAWLRFVVRLESVAIILLSGFFFWKLVGLFLWKSLQFTPETPHLTWIFSAEVAVLGIIAGIGFLSARSWSRLLATALLVAATAAFHFYQPRAVANLAVPTSWQLNVLRAAAVASGWFVLLWLVARLAGLRDRKPRPVMVQMLHPAGLFAMAILTFAFFNFVEPQIGLWRSLMAFDRNSGELVWEAGVPAPSGRKDPTNSFASPTPSTDGEHVVVNFGPVMLGLDFDGKIRWQRREPLFMHYLRHGAAVSPVIYRDRVLYAFYPETREAGDETAGYAFDSLSYLVALDLATGKELWKVESIPGGHDAFGTPLLRPTADGMAILISVNNYAHAYDVETGDQLWTAETPLHVPVPSMVADDRGAYMSGGLFGPAVIAAIGLEDSEADPRPRRGKNKPRASAFGGRSQREPRMSRPRWSTMA